MTMNLLLPWIGSKLASQEYKVPVTIGVSDQDQDEPLDPPFLEIPSIGDLSNDIPVAESTEIEVDQYGAITIPDIPDADTSFDISDRNIDLVNIIEEESVHDVLTETMVEYRGITYSILEGSSQKYTRLLVSSLGYSYGVKMLQMKATTNATRTLIGYLRRQWMDNPVFPAEDWSVYRQKV